MPGLNPKAGATNFILQSFKGFQPRQTNNEILSRALVSNNEKMLDGRDFISMVVLSDLVFFASLA